MVIFILHKYIQRLKSVSRKLLHEVLWSSLSFLVIDVEVLSRKNSIILSLVTNYRLRFQLSGVDQLYCVKLNSDKINNRVSSSTQ